MFAANSPHDNEPYCKKSHFTAFDVPTADTRNIIKAIASGIGVLYAPNIQYYKVGVGLIDLKDAAHFQYDLFSQSSDNPKLMAALDEMNDRFGRSTVHFASQGFTQPFAMKRNYLSNRFTTRIAEIPRIRC